MEKSEPVTIEHYSSNGSDPEHNGKSGIDIVTQHVEASKATRREHELSVKDAIRLYPKAIGFSLIFSTAIIMEGYDLSLLGSLYGYPAFQEKFGTQPGPGGVGKVISADWQTKISNASLAGQIIGLLINGWMSERFGYRMTMLLTQVVMVISIFIPFFAPNIQTILAGYIILGLPWGVFQTLSVTYASEVAPVVLRPYLTTYVNLCWVIGQLIGSGVLRGMLSVTGDWSYRIPFALQWMWPPFLIIGTFFAPESPFWLVRKGRLDAARRSLLRLTSSNSGVDYDADEQVALIKSTNEMEMANQKGINYWHCFQGVDLRRTEIACISYLAQTLCGSALMGFSVQFYQRAGLSTENSFNFNIGQSAMGAVGTILSWFIMGYFGRRTIYLAGMAGLFLLLIIVGGLGFADPANKAPSLAIGSLLLIYTMWYDLTIGPICYALVAEIPSTRHKIKTVVMARSLGNCFGFMNNALMPNFLGVNSWNWGAKTGLFWAAFCLIFLIWAWFRLPEPKGRTFAELDVLFERRVPARKFAETVVDDFDGHSAH